MSGVHRSRGMRGPARMTPLERALAGLVIVLLALGLSYLGLQTAFGTFRDVNTVTVVLGDLGRGLVPDSDVKLRGVLVGRVADIALDEDFRAVVTLELEPQYRVPERARFEVTGKTLLGEKQVEILFDGPFEQGPFLADGALVDDPARVVEFEDVLASVAELFEAIDPDELALVFDELFGAFEGLGPDIARSVDAGADAARVFARSLDDQVANTRQVALLLEALRDEGGEFNRLGRAVEQGMPTISENQQEIRRLLEELSGFSRTLDVTFRVTRDDLDTMIIRGDNIIRLLFDYRPEVGELVTGLVDYTSKFPEGFKAPGVAGEAARFQIIIDPGFAAELCEGLPDELASELPACGAPVPTPSGGASASAPRTEPGGITLDLPRSLVAPAGDGRAGLDALMRRALADPSTGEARR